MKRKILHAEPENEETCEKDNSSSSSNKSDSDDESPVDKFRRGCDLPSGVFNV